MNTGTIHRHSTLPSTSLKRRSSLSQLGALADVPHRIKRSVFQDPPSQVRRRPTPVGLGRAESFLLVAHDLDVARDVGAQLGAEAELTVVSAADAAEALAERPWRAVLVDLALGETALGQVLAGIAREEQAPTVVAITGDALLDAGSLPFPGVRLVRAPLSAAALDEALRPAAPAPRAERRRTSSVARPTPAAAWRTEHAREILGEHPALLEIFDVLSRVADTDCPIVVHGETGTGKELVARAIHSASGRAGKPFVAVNCAALPAELMESELFGHARGAFTGAVAARQGRFAAADGGTLFLDEIGELPLAVQAKLLRALQEKEITPVGETRSTKVDVRIVAATHRNLEEMVAARQFREDLLYRLDVLRVALPALRDRRTDIPLLVQAFVETTAEKRNRPVDGIDEAAMEALTAYAWPGNVRQLQNVVERMVLLRGRGTIALSDVPAPIRAAQGAAGPTAAAHARPELPSDGLDLREAVDRFEAALIDQALARAGGNRSKAALILRMNRTTLVEKLRKRGLGDEAGG